MKQIILWELRQRKSYLFWWVVTTASLVLLLILIYPSIHSQADKLNNIIKSLPAAIKDLKTGGTTVDISSPIGFLNSQVFYATLPLLQIIMAIGLGSSLLAKDEQNHTLELLLARPISRSKLLVAKAITGVSAVTLVAVIALVVMLTVSPLVHLDISAKYLCLTSLYCLLFSLSFGAIAFCLTAASVNTHRLAVAVATFLSLGGYLMATLGNLSHYLQTPAKLAPYHYFNPAEILKGNIAAGLNIYLVSCFIICIVASWIGFRSRDIY